MYTDWTDERPLLPWNGTYKMHLQVSKVPVLLMTDVVFLVQWVLNSCSLASVLTPSRDVGKEDL
jgi:hypothetical protein